MIAQAEHGRAVRSRRAELLLPAEESSPRSARRFAADVVRSADADIAVDDLLLVVSELVTNAVRHGDGGIVLAVDVSRRRVRVEVADGGPLPVGGVTAWLDDGRGLRLVQAVCRSWGASRRSTGKVVWAEL